MGTFKGYRPAGGLGMAPESCGLVRPVPAPTLEERRALCETPATLAGKPAVVTGAMEKTALVICLDGSHRAEYSWITVRRLAAMDVPEHGVIRFGWMK